MSSAHSLRAPTSAFAVLLDVGRLHIVAIAALGCFTFGGMLTGERLFAVAAVCALDWFLVNFVNRAVDLPEDLANGIVGAAWLAPRRRVMVPLAFGVLALSFALAAPLGLPLLAFRATYHALGLAYNLPLLPGRTRVKALYFWKNTASAAGFLITLFAYPLAVAPLTMDLRGALALAAFFFLFELSYEVIYDLRDAPGDAAAGIRTYPVVHGIAGACRIADTLLYASIAMLCAAWTLGWIQWAHFVLVFAPVLQRVLYKRWVRRGIRGSDCVRLTWIGAALLLVYQVWGAIGLPG